MINAVKAQSAFIQQGFTRDCVQNVVPLKSVAAFSKILNY